jgi:hypothetical protein
MSDLSKRETSAIDRILSEMPTKPHAREYFQYARYKTREHENLELGAGSTVGLLIGLFFGGRAWGSIGLGIVAFLATVLLIFFWHWIHAASAFHEHWESN